MKLVKPSDDQLNAAFAEKVAGWTYWQSKHGHYHVTDPNGKHGEPAYGWPKYDESTGKKFVRHWTDGVELPRFTQSADAVLPFVSKLKEVGIHYADGDWFVRCWSEDKNCANCDSLPRACVIALLRAHGVEVET